MEILFGLQKKYLPDALSHEAWQKGINIPFQENDGGVTYQSWIYQTWVLLQRADIYCRLLHCLPAKGIFISQSQSVPPWFTPSEKVFFIDVPADGPPHEKAHLHLVQNKTQLSTLPKSHFMPHWPQPHLMKRDPNRGDRFEHVVYFGSPFNISKELTTDTWCERLKKELGITFRFLDRSDSWHDYRHVDAVIAIRSFSKLIHHNKPAAKLYNAWLAGVPFIGGCDSAYATDGIPGKNYLVAETPEEVFFHLKKLKEDRDFRNMLVSEGEKSGENFTQQATLQRWKELLEVTVPNMMKEQDGLLP